MKEEKKRKKKKIDKNAIISIELTREIDNK